MDGKRFGEKRNEIPALVDFQMEAKKGTSENTMKQGQVKSGHHINAPMSCSQNADSSGSKYDTKV